MTAINAIKIGKTLGPLLEVENGEVPGIICRHHLRIKVEIDTSKPLVPGFHFPRVGRDPIWVRFLYERLANYHILCGLIGHKKKKWMLCSTASSSPSQIWSIFEGNYLLQFSSLFGTPNGCP